MDSHADTIAVGSICICPIDISFEDFRVVLFDELGSDYDPDLFSK